MPRSLPRLAAIWRIVLDPPLFWKLTLPMTLVVGLSTLSSLTSLRTAQRSEASFARLHHDHLLDDRTILRVAALQRRHYLTLTRLVTLTDQKAATRLARTLARLEARRQDAVRELLLRLRARRGATEAPGALSAQQVAQKYGQYTASARAVLARLHRGDQASALALTHQGLLPLEAELSELTTGLEAQQERSSHRRLASARRQQRRERWLTLALHAAGAALALVVSLLVAGALTTRMRLLVACAVALGKGELGARAKLATRDEFGVLARRLNAMARRLTRLFREIDHQHSALRESEQRLQAIVDYSTAAISLKDRAGRHLLVNQRYAELTGLPSNAIVGLTDDAFFPPEIANALAAHDRAVMEKGEPITVEEVFSRGAGAPVFLVMKFALKDAKGRPYALCSMASDITARKEVERLKSEFVSVVSHELRTPLTAIRGALGLLEGGVVGTLPPKARELATLARQNTERLVRLINDILDLEKLEAGKVQLQLQRLTLAEVITRTVDELAPLADGAGIAVDTGAVDAALELSADGDRLSQVLTNLLGNAIKFSPRGTTITIGARGVNQQRLRVSVTDQGAGISAEQQLLLFSRFQQLDGSDARKKGGTGLGLAIARAIVEQHGGRIGVESAPGRGSTFFFELPREQQAYEI